MESATPLKLVEVRGKKTKANSELEGVIRETAWLWRKAHLSYDQSRYVVERVRRLLALEPPPARRRVVERLSREEVERLLEAAYRLHPRKPVYGLMLKTLFYTGVRVSEFVFLRAQDVHLDGEAPHLYVHKAKKDSVRYVPILPALAQELRVHLAGRTRGYLFESNRHERYSPRAIQKLIRRAAQEAGIEKRVYPHLLRHSVAQILLDRGMPLEQLQKFLGHRDLKTTQIYAESSLEQVGESYRRVFRGD
ncbi:Tyrosine recombinase XerD [Meiothermus luteus]|uniref:Tyrosine recombinase XerD n=1 Tax=Meiothermus luteus TaxID=2026184 RepID=A0A399F020_9DEIN|nr:tyrosine-type recombinase/integrase [Meiothermus luteus]RIH90127.1 Tyrosine recombinase XerD [Meiothermus luteus]